MKPNKEHQKEMTAERLSFKNYSSSQIYLILSQIYYIF